MTESWPPKDPDWVESYRYDAGLDAGEQVTAITLERLSGDVDIDSQQPDQTGVTAFLSGGTVGSTTIFRVAWTTSTGRSLDDHITIAVVDQPNAADVNGFRLRYPAFAAVSAETIAYWLQDATSIVTDSWGADQQRGTFALAAHSMTLAGVTGISDGGASQIPAGVTRFKSASVDIAISEAAASRSADGGYGATKYGVEFQAMLRRNVGGPSLVGYVAPCWDMVTF